MIDYYPFGEVRLDEKTGDYENDYKYTGKELDQDTELYYYEARYYDAGMGRFISADPWSGDIRDPQSLNKYAYTKNNPLRYVDPNGKEAVDYIEALGGYAVGFAKGVVSVPVAIGNMIIHPIETAEKTGGYLADAAESGKSLAVDLYNKPSQTLNEVSTGVSIMVDDFTSQSYWDQGESIGNFFGQMDAGIALGAGVSKGAAVLKGEQTAVIGNTLKPGPFAQESIPARGSARNFTVAERKAINEIGNDTGCHTCGTKISGTKSGNFVPDHQPVSSLNYNNSSQKLYPQCTWCSARQGGQASAQSKSSIK